MDTFVDRLHRSNSNNNSSTGNTNTSRRLRSNGSMKGGHASPMFPANGKKRAFENPEPSSPKVTCIGQVRVKTKKQGNKLRTRSKKRGEVSFRRVDQNSMAFEGSNNHQDLMNNQFLNQQQQQQEDLSHRNQRWVHLPVTICETLRAFGAEFNCFLPCRSSCTASEKEKEEKAAAAGSNNNGSSSCGAVFARWLVSVQEEEGKGREIEVVVGEEVEDERDERRRSYRRHVYEEIEFKDEKFGGNEGFQEEEEARVNICIPPKNALLLMRCRSDPVKMAALSNKFWEAPAPQDEEDEGEDYEKDTNLGSVEEKCINVEGKREVWPESITEHREDLFVAGNLDSFETIEEHPIQETGGGLVLLEGGGGADSQQAGNTDEKIDGVLQERNLVKQEEEEPEIHEVMNLNPTSSTRETVRLCRDQSSHDQKFVDPEALMNHENENKMDQENAVDFSDDIEKNPVSVQLEQESLEAAVDDLQDQEPESEEEEKEAEREEEEQPVTHERSKPEDPKTQEAGQTGTSVKSRERDNGQPLLPDCLLLMMCEPKLSMEVSKETWVCSTDFIRWLPEHSRPVNKANGKDEPKKRVSIDRKPAPVHHSNNNNSLQQPARSSCSYPGKPPAHGAGTESMSTMLEQKLVGAKAYDPFVLTRCKSEPMRSASKLAPEACFWMNRKLEPHGPAASLGLGAAGVGF
ncbi:hypothetical protein OIU85_002303 [Salix viminalis]|uniref:Uncharacterized protein n=1 Tax=Salix viminalis TaxID=40686 RepID=A0A9Q0ZZ40_SALVM|nr:hypothetical protein OIU85_002303 [Salix viminalis]